MKPGRVMPPITEIHSRTLNGLGEIVEQKVKRIDRKRERMNVERQGEKRKSVRSLKGSERIIGKRKI